MAVDALVAAVVATEVAASVEAATVDALEWAASLATQAHPDLEVATWALAASLGPVGWARARVVNLAEVAVLADCAGAEAEAEATVAEEDWAELLAQPALQTQLPQS